MENASKALIIAGAILISILLISVGILVFNSISEVTDDAGETGDIILSQAAITNAEIILGTIEYEDNDKFNEYIYNNYHYNGIGNKYISSQKVEELCALVVRRSEKITGKGYNKDETRISSVGQSVTSNSEGKITEINKDKEYKVTWGPEEKNGKIIYSIYINEIWKSCKTERSVYSKGINNKNL